MTDFLFRTPSVAICLLLFLTLGACKSRKKTQQSATAPQTMPVEDTANIRCRLDFKNARSLSRYVRDNAFRFDWVTAKAEVETNIDGKEENFDIKLSIKKDSAMLISIRYLLGLEVAKVLITRDSVRFVNYVSKNYFRGDFNYINNLLNADLDFDLLQAVLFGNSAEYLDDETKLKPVTDRQNCRYLLSTVRKRRLRRIQSGEELKDAMQTMTLQPDNFKILNNEFIDPASNRRFVAAYSNFLEKDSVFAPRHVDIEIAAQKKASLKIDYVRIEKNTPQKLNLSIPSKYEELQLQKQ